MTTVTLAPTRDVHVVRDLSVATFTETFAADNTEEDLAEFLAHDYAEDVLQREIDDPDSVFVLAEVDGVPAGYMKVNVGEAQTEPHDGRYLEVQRIYILAGHKGHGLGTRLMREAFAMARRLGKTCVWLGVWEHNDAAQAFYGKFGFVRTGEHGFLVGDDLQTDWIMEARVPGAEA